MWVVRAASFVLALSISVGQEAPKWSRPDEAEQNNGWIPLARDQVGQASARALSQAPQQNQLVQSPGFSQDVPLDSFQQGSPVFRQEEPTRIPQQVFQQQQQFVDNRFPPQLLQHQLPPEFLNQQFQQQFGQQPFGQQQFGQQQFGQQFSVGQPLLPPFINPQESFLPPPPPPPPPPAPTNLQPSLKEQSIQGLQESNYNPNLDIKGLEPPRLPPSTFTDELRPPSISTGFPRQNAEKPTPTNDGKEEVQILYVPVETLKQRNKENKGPSIEKEQPKILQNEPPRRPIQLPVQQPIQRPVQQPIQLPVQQQIQLSNRPVQILPQQPVQNNGQKDGEKKFRHPIQPLQDQRPALHLKNYQGLNPSTGIIHTTPTPKMQPEYDSQLDTTQQVSTLIKTTQDDDRRDYQVSATEPTQFNNFRNQQSDDTYFGTGSEHRSSVRPSPVGNLIPQLDDYTPSTLPPPNQPPLSVYMETASNTKVGDILSLLKGAKTIPVLDTIGPESPQVFVGPSNLKPPHGYVKFELPYLSSLDGNRVERKVLQLPFFVAPLNFQPPQGYSKIPFPPPHIGSVVLSNNAPKSLNPPTENPTQQSPLPVSRPSQYREPYTIPAEISSISPQLPSLINSLQEEDHYPSSSPALTQSEEITEATLPPFKKQTHHSRRPSSRGSQRGSYSSTPRTTTRDEPQTRRPYSQRQRRPVNRNQSRFTPSPTTTTTEEIENTPKTLVPSQYLSETPQNNYEKDSEKFRYDSDTLTTKQEYYNPHDATPATSQEVYHKPTYNQDYSKEEELPTTESFRPSVVRTEESSGEIFNNKDSSVDQNVRPFSQDFTNGENFKANPETLSRTKSNKLRGSNREQSRPTYDDTPSPTEPSFENQRFRNTVQPPSVQLSQDDGLFRASPTPDYKDTGSSYRQENEYLSPQYNTPDYRTTPSSAESPSYLSSQEPEYYDSRVHQKGHDAVNQFQDSSSLTQTPTYEQSYKSSQESGVNKYGKDSREDEKSHFDGQHRLKIHADEPKVNLFEEKFTEPVPTTQKYLVETTTEAHVEKTTQHRTRGRVRGRTYSSRRTTTEAPNYPSISSENKDVERQSHFTDTNQYTSAERKEETVPTTQPPAQYAEQPSRSSTGKFSRTRPLQRRPLRTSSTLGTTTTTTTSAPGTRYLIRTRRPTQVQTKLQTGRSRIKRPTSPTTTTEATTTKNSYSQEDFNDSPVYTGHFPVNTNRGNKYDSSPVSIESEPEPKPVYRGNENHRFVPSVKSASHEEREEEKYYESFSTPKKTAYTTPVNQEEFTLPHRYRPTESYDSNVRSTPAVSRFNEYDEAKVVTPKRPSYTTPVYQEEFTVSNRHRPTESYENNVKATSHSPTVLNLNDYDETKTSYSTPSSEENKYDTKVRYSTPQYEDDVKIKVNTYDTPQRGSPQRQPEDSYVAERKPTRHRQSESHRHVEPKGDKKESDDFWNQAVTIQQSKSYEYEPDSPVFSTPQPSASPTSRKRKPSTQTEYDYEDYYNNQDSVKYATGDQAPFPSNDQQITYTGGKDSLKIGKDNQYPVKEVQEGPESTVISEEDSVKETPVTTSTEKAEEVQTEEDSSKPRPSNKGGKRRGVWVRVRVKKPADVFETAESQSFGSLSSNTLHHVDKKTHGDKHWTSPDDKKSDANDTTTTSTTTTTTEATSPANDDTSTTSTSERPLTIMEQFQTTLADMMKSYAGSNDGQIQSSTETSTDVSTSSLELTTVFNELTTLLSNKESVTSTVDESSIDVTTEMMPITSTQVPSLESKVLGTSTTTEISLETEICFRGRCVKTKRTKGKDDSDLMPIE